MWRDVCIMEVGGDIGRRDLCRGRISLVKASFRDRVQIEDAREDIA